MPEPFRLDQSTIHRWFSSETFQAFVLDFNDTIWWESEDESIEYIFKKIFSDIETYRKFLLFCSENECSFVDGQKNKNLSVAIFLLAFEQAKDEIAKWVKDDIWEILWLNDSVLNLMFANDIIPGTDFSYVSRLMHSVYHKNIINEQWEVIYYLWTEFGFQRVYSRERWVHYVDDSWNIIDIIENNRIDRRDMLQDLEESLQDILLIWQSDYSNQDAIRLIELRREYEEDIGKIFTWTREEELHFRSWVWQKYNENLSIWGEIKKEDIRKTKLEIVGWTYLGDGKWEKWNTVQGDKSRNYIRVVK